MLTTDVDGRIVVYRPSPGLLSWQVARTSSDPAAVAGAIVRELNAQDPNWYRRMMANQIEIRGLWAIRTKHLWQRLPRWWALPPSKRIIKLPTTLALSLFDFAVMWLANRRLVSGRAVGYW